MASLVCRGCGKRFNDASKEKNFKENVLDICPVCKQDEEEKSLKFLFYRIPKGETKKGLGQNLDAIFAALGKQVDAIPSSSTLKRTEPDRKPPRLRLEETDDGA